MRVEVSSSEPNRPERTEAAVQPSVPLALTLSLSIVGVAVVYFGALYLIAH